MGRTTEAVEGSAQKHCTVTAPAEGEQPAAAAKKTKKVRVPESRMDMILAGHPSRRMPPYPNLDVLSDEPELQEQLRAQLDKAQAMLRKSYYEDEAIYQQYLVKGYAKIGVEVDNDGQDQE